MRTPLNKFIESGNALWNAMLIDNIYTPPKSIKFIHKKSINFQKPPSKCHAEWHNNQNKYSQDGEFSIINAYNS